MRRHTVLLSVVFGIALSSPAALGARTNRAHPVSLPELESAASITRDVHGIAHIRADNEHDLFFLQGWVHAEDRLFQMDITRRQASGTLAELFGPGALAGDVQLRTFGLRRAAEASLPAYSPSSRAAFRAYADGVNAWVARHDLPAEYGLLELTGFEPWTALDSVAVTKILAFGLSFDIDDIDRTVTLLTYIQAGNALGFDGQALFFEDTHRSQPFSAASTVPDASGAAPVQVVERTSADAGFDPGFLDPGALVMAKRFRERFASVPFLKGSLADGERAGSNEWAVSGANTDSGLPLLANDPHLALNTPSTFYPIHLRGGAIDAMGSGFAGAPAVVIGRTARISWGATVNPMDVTDVFQEQIAPDPTSPSGLSIVHEGVFEPILPIPESYRVNQVGNGVLDDVVPVPPSAGLPPVTLIVPRRNNGPIIDLDTSAGTALSLQYTGFGQTREGETFLAWNRAGSLDEFIAGLRFFDFGSQNWVYADVDGNIAYFTSAEMPVREDLQAMTVNGLPPWFIRNGTGGNEWMPVQNPQPGQSLPFEILPMAEMPHLVNPPAGWFVNANNDPAGTTLDNDPLNQLRPGGGLYYLSPGYDGFRAGRVAEALRERLTTGDGKISFDEMQQIQADVTLIDAEVLAPWIVQAMANAGQSGADPTLAAYATDAALVEAVGRLAAWDHRFPTGIPEGYDAADLDGERLHPSADEVASSVAATIYAVWRGQFVRNVIDSRLAPLGLPVPGSALAMSAVRNLLDHFDTNHGVGASGIDFFAVPGVAAAADRRDVLILQSLRDALDLLAGGPFAPAFGNSTDQDDYRWGRLHRIVLDHPLGGPFDIPPAGGAFPAPLPGLPGIPVDGGFGAVDASSHDVRADAVNEFMFGSGPARRFVTESHPDTGIRAESIWPGGTSGQLGSPWYFNLLPLWLTNDTVPHLFGNADLVKNAHSVTRFVPGRGGRPSSGAAAGSPAPAAAGSRRACSPGT